MIIFLIHPTLYYEMSIFLKTLIIKAIPVHCEQTKEETKINCNPNPQLLSLWTF